MGGWRRAWRFLDSRDEFDLSGGMPRLVYIQSGVDRDHELKDFLERVRDAGLSYKQFRSHAELESLLKDDLTVLLTERFFAPEDRGSGRTPAPIAFGSHSFVGRDKEQEEITNQLGREDIRLSLASLTVLGCSFRGLIIVVCRDLVAGGVGNPYRARRRSIRMMWLRDDHRV
jgi:hypothetical protein